MRGGEVGRLVEGESRDPGLMSCSGQREKLEASGLYMLQPHVEVVKGMYICTKRSVDAQ